MKNCLKIIKEYLKANGFDGLQSYDEDCGCELSDLIPCDNDFSMCIPGYKVIPPENLDCEFDFFICDNKDSGMPWE